VDTTYRVEGVDELRRSLKAVDGGVKQLRKANKDVAKAVEGRSRSRSGSGTAQQAKVAKALLGTGEASRAVIKIRNLGSVPFGIGAFMGALAWKQFPPWVGNNWTLGQPGEGPYVLRDVFDKDFDEVVVEPYMQELQALFAAAQIPLD